MAEKQVDAPAPPPPKSTLARSVESAPLNINAGPGGGNNFTFWLASVADTFEPWGRDYVKRDQQLRDFFHSETFLSGAVYTSAISNAQLEWSLDGPDETVEAVQELLDSANMGKGWAHFAKALSLDLYTQDNAGFVEIIRASNSPESPVLGIQTLDSARCQRTGDLNIPVIYTDVKGTRHKMPWYSVVTFEEFPSNIETMYGLQYSAVTRALRAAQILRDMAIYRGEKAGGRFADAIHIVGGVSSTDLEDVKKRAEEQGDNAGLARYLGALVIGSLDPEATPSVATLDFKSLPEAFDYDQEMRWYVSSLALAFGRDYQDFAPLPSSNLGSGQQSETLHKKARQKASAAFMRMIEQVFNMNGIMPQTVTFNFDLPDLEEDMLTAEVAGKWATAFDSLTASKIVTPEAARQILQDEGIFEQDQIGDITEDDFPEPEPMQLAGQPQASPNGNAPGEKDILEAMFASLAHKAEGTPALAAYLEDSAQEITRDPVIMELAKSVRETADEMKFDLADLQTAFDNTVATMQADTIEREKATNIAVRSLRAALADMLKSEKRRESVSEIRVLTKNEVDEKLADMEVISSEIKERDDKGRADIIEKKFASGRIAKYKVIRDRAGKTKKMKEIR